MRNRITILDFANDRVIIRDVPPELIGKDAEEIAEYFANDLGIRPFISVSNCEYMVGQCTIDAQEVKL